MNNQQEQDQSVSVSHDLSQSQEEKPAVTPSKKDKSSERPPNQFKSQSFIGVGTGSILNAQNGASQQQNIFKLQNTGISGKDSNQSNLSGRKFIPSSQRSKSFIKTQGFNYNQVNQYNTQTAPQSDAFKSNQKSSRSQHNFKNSEDAQNMNKAFQSQDQQNLKLSKQLSSMSKSPVRVSNINLMDKSFNNSTTDRQDSTFTNSIFDQSNSKDNVKVCVRVRPTNQRENKGAKAIQVDNGSIVLDRGYDHKKFHFDYVAEESVDQQQIFNQIAKPIADSCMQGYNGTIFAYGQTGAGKTYTIQGPMISVEGLGEQMALQNGTSDLKGNRGIMQRSYEYIFQNIEAQKKLTEEKADGSELNFLIKCSYLEIYNEQIMDLLEPNSVNLQVREDIKKGVYVEGLQEDVVNSFKDMIALIQKGSKNRHVGATSMNRESSRSHSVLTTILESKSMSNTGVWNMKTSRFHIIDLAGSERSKNTNTVGERLKEAGMINKSLSALGNVINSLVDLSEGKSRHVPYRDSKLTFILRDSLGGNSKTVIIANISPSSVNVGETLSTLEFAKRAKQIKNKAIVNEDSSGTILILKNEIKRLKKDMMEQDKIHRIALNSQDNQSGACKMCKQQIAFDKIDDSIPNSHDDSLLLDGIDNDDSRDLSLQKRMSDRDKKNLGKANERIQHVEQLLCTNLSNLTSQQHFYEQEIVKFKDQILSLNQAYEALNSQVSRDKMKMKLREDKIQKLEQEHKIENEENVKMLKEEIQLLQKQIEQDKQELTNPKIVKLQSDIQTLKEQNGKLQKELLNEQGQHDELTLLKQFSDQKGLIDDLNKYLKEKGSQEAFSTLEGQFSNLKLQNQATLDKQSQLFEQTEDLQQQYDILMQNNVSAEETNQKLTREYGRAKVEQQQLSEQANEQMKQIQRQLSLMDEQSRKLTEFDQNQLKLEKVINDNESQSKERLHTLQSEMASFKKSLAGSKEIEQDLNNQIVQKNIQIENWKTEMKDSDHQKAQLKEEVERYQNKLEEQLKTSEMLLVQIDEINKQKTKAVTQNSQSLEQIKEGQTKENQMKEKVKELQKVLVEQENQFQGKIQQLEKEIKDRDNQSGETQQEMLKLKDQYGSKDSDLCASHSKISDLESQVKKLETDIDSLSKEKTELSSELKTKLESEKASMKKKMEEKLAQMNTQMEQTLSTQKNEQEQKIKKIQEVQQEIIKESQEKDDEISLKTEEIQEQMKELSILQKNVTTYKHEIQLKSSEIEELKEMNKNKVNDISYLDQSIDQMNYASQEKENQIDQLNEYIQNIEKQRAQLQQEIADKNNVTAGQEQDQAESQVLLIEAQEVLNQKISENSKLLKQISEKEEIIQEKDAELDKIDQGLKQQEKLLTQIQEEKVNNESQIGSLTSTITKFQDQVKQLEVEKDNLQFKRDENMKQLESKIKELKKELKSKTDGTQELETENNLLQAELEKIKNVQMLDQENKIQSLELKLQKQQTELAQEQEKLNSNKDSQLEQLQEKSEKNSNLLKEVAEMQVYIDDLSDQLNQAKRGENEAENIKQDCYCKIDIIKKKLPPQGVEGQSIDEEKSKIKECLSQILAEFSDFDSISNEQIDQDHKQSLEVKLLISQMICEMSRLYEKQIVLERQKSSGDFKKYSEKYEKQKQDIKQMQQYHVQKVEDLQSQNQKQKEEIKYSMEKKLAQDVLQKVENKQEEIASMQKEINQYNQKINKYEQEIECKHQKHQEINEELQRYKEYLPEAEGLLQEVNQRHMTAVEEVKNLQMQITQNKCINQQYESEILDLNKNLKNQKKMLLDQKQLYEVRVQSQEQEIEQHQYRYKELEARMSKQIAQQEAKLDQVKDQVQIFQNSTQQAKNDREEAISQMIELQHQVDLVQQHDADQVNKIQNLEGRLYQREQEMAEAVKTLKQFGEANKIMQLENDNLRLEMEQLVGHRNPNQKIQLHQKIKEENNKLRENNLLLQEDLQKKMEIIQKLQKQDKSNHQQQMANGESNHQNQKNEQRLKKDFENLMVQIQTQPQFEKLAISQGIQMEIGGSKSLQKTIQLVTIVDDTLEAINYEKSQLQEQVSILSHQLTKLSNAAQVAQNKEFNQKQPLSSRPPQPTAMRSPLLKEGFSKGELSQMGPPSQRGNQPGQQNHSLRNGSASGRLQNEGQQRQTSQSRAQHAMINQMANHGVHSRDKGERNSSRSMLQQQMTNYQQNLQHNSSGNLIQNQQQQFSQHGGISAGSPVTLNSYSSLYKQNQSRERSRGETNQANDRMNLMKPEKENEAAFHSTQKLGGYSAIQSRSKQRSGTPSDQNIHQGSSQDSYHQNRSKY